MWSAKEKWDLNSDPKKLAGSDARAEFQDFAICAIGLSGGATFSAVCDEKMREKCPFLFWN